MGAAGRRAACGRLALALALLASCLAVARAAGAGCEAGDLTCACKALGGVPTVNRKSFNATCRLFVESTVTRGECGVCARVCVVRACVCVCVS